jgi:hypothetical protein
VRPTIAAGVLLGGVTLVLVEVLRLAARVSARMPGPRWLVAGAGGAGLAGLAAVSSSRYLGLGLDTIEEAVSGAAVPPEALASRRSSWSGTAASTAASSSAPSRAARCARPAAWRSTA